MEEELIQIKNSAVSLILDAKDKRELDDLKIVLEKAKIQYQIEGIITGAVFSTYQRDRIERICDELEDNQFRWAEEHGATQDRETGEWQV